MLEDSQNDPLQAEANRDLWGKILATENGQNAIANADQDQVNKLIENGFLAFNDGKYSLNNPNAEVPKDSQTITKSDITALGIPGQDTNTTYNDATQSNHGLMSTSDKKKLDNISSNSQNTVYSSSQPSGQAIGDYWVKLEG